MNHPVRVFQEFNMHVQSAINTIWHSITYTCIYLTSHKKKSEIPKNKDELQIQTHRSATF